jgi:hypothetical protein
LSEPTPHRFVEYTDGNPILVSEVELQSRESKPGYWVATSRVTEQDVDDGDFGDCCELQSAAYRFDTLEKAFGCASERLAAGFAAFVFWGWRVPLMARPASISFSGGGIELCHELADGQLHNAGKVVVDFEDADSGAEDDDSDS